MLLGKTKRLKLRMSKLLEMNDALLLKVGRQKKIINQQDIVIRNLNNKIAELKYTNECIKKDLQHEVERRNIDRLKLLTQIKEERTKVML